MSRFPRSSPRLHDLLLSGWLALTPTALGLQQPSRACARERGYERDRYRRLGQLHTWPQGEGEPAGGTSTTVVAGGGASAVASAGGGMGTVAPPVVPPEGSRPLPVRLRSAAD